MILGLLSDTHDNLVNTKLGVQILLDAGAQHFIHCGDVGSEAIFDCLAGYPLAFVWGNNDWDRVPLARYAEGLGFTCLGDGGELELAGKKLFVTHGDHARIVNHAFAQKKYDYLFLGHTHVVMDTRMEGVRVISPGALHRASRKTVATLDLQTDSLRWFDVK